MPKRTKTAVYTDRDGNNFEVSYDPDAPCWMCGLAVEEASMGGTVICPSCDCGLNRDGSQWSPAEAELAFQSFRDNQARAERAAEERMLHPAPPGPRSRPSHLAERGSLA